MSTPARKRGLTRQQLIETLADRIEAAHEREKDIERLGRDIEKYCARIRVMESAAEIDRTKIETLKAMLRASETQIADLKGYLRRVEEDDHARDGFFTGVDQVPVTAPPIARRQPRNYFGPTQADYDPGPGAVSGVYSKATRDAARFVGGSEERSPTWRYKHWSQW